MSSDRLSPWRKKPAEASPMNSAAQVTRFGVMNRKRARTISMRVATGSTRKTVHQASRFLQVSFWTARSDSLAITLRNA